MFLLSFPTRERGLKSHALRTMKRDPLVVPHAGTWIEIKIPYDSPCWIVVVPHAGTWIEIFLQK